MAENTFTITPDDTSIGQQYVDTFRRSEYLEPEKSLLAAILEDGIQEYRKYNQAHDADGKRRFCEAEEWIMRRDDDWIFSFETVCNALGLDPEYIRSGVIENKRKPAEEKKSLHRDGMRKRAA